MNAMSSPELPELPEPVAKRQRTIPVAEDTHETAPGPRDTPGSSGKKWNLEQNQMLYDYQREGLTWLEISSRISRRYGHRSSGACSKQYSQLVKGLVARETIPPELRQADRMDEIQSPHSNALDDTNSATTLPATASDRPTHEPTTSHDRLLDDDSVGWESRLQELARGKEKIGDLQQRLGETKQQIADLMACRDTLQEELLRNRQQQDEKVKDMTKRIRDAAGIEP